MSLTQSQWDAQRREAKERAAQAVAANRAEAEQRLLEERGAAKAAELAGHRVVKAAEVPEEVEVETPEAQQGSGEAPDDQSE
ncbi:hypothetical protein SEA_ERLA_7 [Microbacterium phage Erla]|uniref:Uncharacterized protein n=5 Tax=Ilzatvirus ilzat TaxID=2560593 RepID=A0A7T0M2V5_9CAUD|nr:hypothetical protein PBI_NATTLES_7 [Microbacterium phage Nattles]AVO25185.1 hypothetical protein PBI_GELO_7 [Microbacterium phage Gelo]QDF18960.1 hypothetical protein SEA_ETTA_7 [Microbacterium phage Etta]QFG08245.1 hypothetical protein PBI_CALIX_7 [Microbacterium phage Calix]QPL15105.1 hypothetical protein SEA_ERLA_7 [Microbacterium phage Erla]WNO28254.1 hypothetical protein SEA_GAREY24_7 [Microbacterium phage Garey24]